jgi:hypothetical protein
MPEGRNIEMKIGNLTLALVVIAGSTVLLGAQPNSENRPPHLEKRGDIQQLVVNGKPFLVLGGGLQPFFFQSRIHEGRVAPPSIGAPQYSARARFLGPA